MEKGVSAHLNHPKATFPRQTGCAAPVYFLRSYGQDVVSSSRCGEVANGSRVRVVLQKGRNTQKPSENPIS
jgi:hypothetical protein